VGPVYQAGTLSGNPLAMAAGLATLSALDADAWAHLEQASDSVVGILRREAEVAGVPIQATSVGGMFGFFFSEEPVSNWNDASEVDRDRFSRFFHGMLDQGIYLAPSPFEAGFVSTFHATAELEAFEAAVRAAMSRCV
jgi:glutamate-1-semialdehyde 2,1-aminomutase